MNNELKVQLSTATSVSSVQYNDSEGTITALITLKAPLYEPPEATRAPIDLVTVIDRYIVNSFVFLHPGSGSGAVVSSGDQPGMSLYLTRTSVCSI